MAAHREEFDNVADEMAADLERHRDNGDLISESDVSVATEDFRSNNPFEIAGKLTEVILEYHQNSTALTINRESNELIIELDVNRDRERDARLLRILQGKIFWPNLLKNDNTIKIKLTDIFDTHVRLFKLAYIDKRLFVTSDPLTIPENVVPSNQATPVLQAAEQGNLSELQASLDEEGEGLGEQDNNGNTPLLIAAIFGHTELVAWLLQKGPSVTEVNGNDDNALLLAALHGHTDIVALILEEHNQSNTQLDSQNTYGNTALFQAAYGGHVSTLDYLLLHGASVDQRNRANQTVLEYIAAIESARFSNRSYSWRFVALAIQFHQRFQPFLGIDNIPQNQLNEFLQESACSGCQFSMKQLLGQGAYIETQNNHGYRPLHHAAGYGHFECTRLLLEKGAIIDAGDSIGRQPIHAVSYAAFLGKTWNTHCSNEEERIRILELLLNTKRDLLEAKSAGNWTPLCHAVSAGGSVRIFQFLIEHEADTNVRVDGNYTLLHLVVRPDPRFKTPARATPQRQEMMRILIEEHRVDFNAQNDDGETALKMAQRLGAQGLVDCLKKLIQVAENEQGVETAAGMSMN